MSERNVNFGVSDVLLHPGDALRESVRRSLTQDTNQIFSRGVVIDCLVDPSNLSDDVVKEFTSIDSDNYATNVDELISAPRNSVILKIVDGAKDRLASQTYLAFPFFPPHICLPVKPGEHVWVYGDSPNSAVSRKYWISRIPEITQVDDLNFTHSDRRFDSLETDIDKTTSDEAISASQENSKNILPGFPNGVPKSSEMQTLEEANAYEDINSQSLSRNRHAPEPVPRYTSRPGDTVLQGSNNTLISLGQDRGYSKELPKGSNPNESSALDKAEDFSGTIDIVAGRSRSSLGNSFFDTVSPKTENTEGTTVFPSVENYDNFTTTPPMTQNSRGQIEVDKVTNSKNPKEGDPSFFSDASRIYVSMKTNGDSNFSLGTLKAVPAGSETNEAVDVPPVDSSPYIVAKSNEIRIIARQTVIDDNVIDNGSIKLVKEGIPGNTAGRGRAAIILGSDGSIMIDGPKIVLGSGFEKENGNGQQISLGVSATEPLVLGNQLKTLLEALDDKLTDIINAINTHTHATPVGVSSPPTNVPEFTKIDQDKKLLFRDKLVSFLSKNGKTK